MGDELVELRAGDDRVLVSPPHGGRLASLYAGGAERLRNQRTSQGSATPIHWGCYLMAPWVGRLRHGRLPTGDGEFTMPANFGAHAIHGTTFDRRWDVVEATPVLVAMAHDLAPPWPMGGVARQVIRLRPGRLDLVAEVQAGDRAMPAALGWHPWFVVADADRTFVTLEAAATLAVDDDLVPTGALRPLTATTRLTGERPLGDRRLDHTYTEPGTAATIAGADLTMHLDWLGPVSAVTVHSPAGFLCVEPLTAWPNAAPLAAAGVDGTGLARLGPQERLRAAFRVRWHGSA